MKNFEFLFWAYNIIWAGIAFYVVFLLLKLRRIDRKIERLERAITREAGS